MRLLLFVLLGFAAWLVAMGGLASLQDKCGEHYAGFGECGRAYRFSWWVIAYQFVILAGLAFAVTSNLAHRTMNSWVGLFAVASVLAIYGADEFLSMQSAKVFADGAPLNRARCTTAGWILLAIVNLLLTFMVGMEDDCAECGERQARREQKVVVDIESARPAATN